MKIIDDSTQQYASKLSSPESSVSEHVFDRQKWQSLTIFEQMGNIGSEVGRAFAARRRGDTATMTGAWQRGLDLLDATAEQLARQKSPKLREVLRARELFAGMERIVGGLLYVVCGGGAEREIDLAVLTERFIHGKK